MQRSMCSFFFFSCGFTPENNDQFFISILSLIIRSEWVLCKTKLKIWLFTALSPSMQIINHSDIKSIVCSLLIFETWLNDVRFVLVQRAECEETVCPVTAEAWLRAASSESLRLVLKQTTAHSKLNDPNRLTLTMDLITIKTVCFIHMQAFLELQ